MISSTFPLHAKLTMTSRRPKFSRKPVDSGVFDGAFHHAPGPARLYMSRTPSNPGRWFFGCCSRNERSRCGFFLWADDWADELAGEERAEREERERMRDEREAALVEEIARLRRELDAAKAANQARGVAGRGFPSVVPGFRCDSLSCSLTSKRAPSAAAPGQARQDRGRQDGNDCAGGLSRIDTAFM